MRYGLALGGGGARGIFQAGVWQALCELGKSPAVIVGTSVGAINAALFAIGDDPTKLWINMELCDIIKTDNNCDNIFSLKSLASLFSCGVNGGFDTSPLRERLESAIDEKRLRASSVDFGLCTYSVKYKRAVELFKNEIPHGKIVDYILASACFPLFQPIEIDGEEFSDGGIRNNLPENMLIKRCMDTIISVSCNGIGLLKDTDRCGVNIISIEPYSNECGLMGFEKKQLHRCMQSGYFEALKVFGKICGTRFYIDKNSYYEAVLELGYDIIRGTELAADMSGVERLKIYSFKELAQITINSYTNSGTLRHMVDFMERGGNSFIREKLDSLGDSYEAASSVVYLKKLMKK